MSLWRVRLGSIAEDDLDDILIKSVTAFGVVQARAYEDLIGLALSQLESGPDLFGSVRRDDIAPGYRTFHISRRGRRARHLLVYHALDGRIVEVVRILHDRMDLARHLPPDPT